MIKKKTLLIMGSIPGAVIPIATVISCGGTKPTKPVKPTTPVVPLSVDQIEANALGQYFKDVVLTQRATSPITNIQLKDLLIAKSKDIIINIVNAGHSFLIYKGTLSDDGVSTPISLTINHKNGKSLVKDINITLPKSVLRVNTEQQAAADKLKDYFSNKSFTPQTNPITNLQLKTLLNVGEVKLNIEDKGHRFVVDKLTLTDDEKATDIRINITHKNGKTSTKLIKITLSKSDARKQLLADDLLKLFGNHRVTGLVTYGITNVELRAKLIAENGGYKTKIKSKGHSFTVDKKALIDNDRETDVRIVVTHKNGKTATKLIKVTLPYSKEWMFFKLLTITSIRVNSNKLPSEVKEIDFFRSNNTEGGLDGLDYSYKIISTDDKNGSLVYINSVSYKHPLAPNGGWTRAFLQRTATGFKKA